MVLLNQSSLDQFRQPNEWSCGVYALRYLLRLNHYDLLPTEQVLKTTEKEGTEPEEIIAYLERNGIFNEVVTGSLEDVRFPSLVMYRWFKDDHYSVMVGINSRFVFLFNPYNANIDRHTLEDFLKRWHPKTFQAMWSLTIQPKGVV